MFNFLRSTRNPRTRSRLARASAILIGLVVTRQVSADILVVNQLGSSGARRYRESDGAFLGTAGTGGESISGWALGPDGNLYLAAADLGGGGLQGEILRSNPATGGSLGALVPLGQNGLSGGGGLAFTNGSVFTRGQTTSPAADGLLRFNATTGAFQGVAVAPGSGGLGGFKTHLTMPGGDLLLADTNRFNRYDKTTLNLVGTFVAPGSGGVSNITDATFGPDGNLYVSSFNTDSILRFNGTTGAFIDTFVPSITDPLGLAFGLDGNFYAVSAGNPPAVNRYNGTTGAFLNTLVSGPTDLRLPWGLLTAPPVPEPGSAVAMAVAGSAAILRARRRHRLA